MTSRSSATGEMVEEHGWPL
uniref:Uncharacterized protein n=1 Tax=Arundo donax TaxID=35708 RepID=A0A0A9CCK7_ARUDO